MCFSLPLILMMSYASLRKEIHIDWTAPAYLSLIPATTWWLLVRLRAIAMHPGVRRLRWEPSVAWFCGGCILLSISGLTYLLTLQPRMQTLAAFGPWRELAAIVEREEDLLEGHEPLIVCSGKYKMASVIAFYRTPLERDVRAADFTTNDSILIGGQGLGYTYWATPNRWKYDRIIFVADSDERLTQVGRRYANVRVLYDSGKTYPRRYQIALCQSPRL